VLGLDDLGEDALFSPRQAVHWDVFDAHEGLHMLGCVCLTWGCLWLLPTSNNNGKRVVVLPFVFAQSSS
jgi:hypothetical protein